jgi:hypothetical protein
MGRADFYQDGDWNTVCYQCGFKGKASQMERNWQGYYVHPEHNEPRQTQDFVRGVPDNQIPPWVQPWPTPVYNYNLASIGLGDSVTRQFQLGDGLYATTVTAVTVGGVTSTWTDNGFGLITLPTAPGHNVRVAASGSEAA